MKKIKSLRLVIVFFLLTFTFLTAKSQVVYTDINPDAFIDQQDSIKFDVNGDGNTDLIISQYTYQYGQIFNIIPSTATQIAITNDSASAINNGEVIDENLIWSDTSVVNFLGHGFYYSYSTGNWARTQNAYLGIRILKEEQWYYSWLRIHREKDGDEYYFELVYALDIGFESQYNQSIIAGDGIPSQATSVFASVNVIQFDGRDINVSFIKAIDESLYREYRIIVAKKDDPNALDLDIMNNLPDDKYISILIDTSNHDFKINQVLFQETLDIDGDLVQTLIPYQIHLLNVASSEISDENTLSTPSNLFILQTQTLGLMSLHVFDVDDNSSSSDIQLSFKIQPDNNYADHYRVFISPVEDIETLTPEFSLSLSSEYYTRIEKNQSYPYSINLTNIQFDINGNSIHSNKFYQIIALSVADSIYSNTSVLSSPSRKIILKSPNAYSAGQKTGENIQTFNYDTVLSNTQRWDGNYTEQGGESFIDINRDGHDDFHLEYIEVSSPFGHGERYRINCERNNKVLICEHTEHSNWIEPLSENEIIDDGYKFTNEQVLLTGYSYAGGSSSTTGHLPFEFSGIQYYIGFLVLDGDQPQYAWLKLSGKIFLEYGYQDFSSSILEIDKQYIYHIFPNPSSGLVSIESFENTNNKRSISVYNTLGLKLDEMELNHQKSIIDLNFYGSGIYYLVIQEDGTRLETHKIIIE